MHTLSYTLLVSNNQDKFDFGWMRLMFFFNDGLRFKYYQILLLRQTLLHGFCWGYNPQEGRSKEPNITFYGRTNKTTIGTGQKCLHFCQRCYINSFHRLRKWTHFRVGRVSDLQKTCTHKVHKGFVSGSCVIHTSYRLLTNQHAPASLNYDIHCLSCLLMELILQVKSQVKNGFQSTVVFQ